MSTAILFAPDNVEQALAKLPTVAGLIPSPHDEGEDSVAFPGVLRKTHRELYRWIANTHYSHLADAVHHLERTYKAGCRFGSLLTTRDREQFVSLSNEVLVADDLLRRGYTVSTVQRSNDPSPDLHVAAEGIDLAVEVYSPREFLAFDAWQKAVSDLFQYVDIPASYDFNADTAIERTLPPDPSQRLDPWAIAEMVAQTREPVLAEITRDVEDELGSLRPLTKTYRHPGMPLLTTVELGNVRKASPDGAQRIGTFSIPGFGGYSPAGVFRTVAERALKKASKRQTFGVPAVARALVVYLMGTKIAEDLMHPAHLRQAEPTLNGIDPRTRGLDAIAFVVRALPEGLAAIFTVFDDAKLTHAQVQALFGQSA